jgi:hypothetical protein
VIREVYRKEFFSQRVLFGIALLVVLLVTAGRAQ